MSEGKKHTATLSVAGVVRRDGLVITEEAMRKAFERFKAKGGFMPVFDHTDAATMDKSARHSMARVVGEVEGIDMEDSRISAEVQLLDTPRAEELGKLIDLKELTLAHDGFIQDKDEEGNIHDYSIEAVSIVMERDKL